MVLLARTGAAESFAATFLTRESTEGTDAVSGITSSKGCAV